MAARTRPDEAALQSELRPYEVQVDGFRRSRFSDLRDAIPSARLVRRDRPFSRVEVLVRPSGAFAVAVE